MWILGLKGLKKCACEKTSTLKVDHRDVAIQFYPWFKFFFFPFFFVSNSLSYTTLPEKQWKRIKTEPQHRHEKMSNNLSDRKKTLMQFLIP